MSNSDAIIPTVDGRVGRILVADDEAKNRELLRDILEAQGHQVTLAEDGQQALECVLAAAPDVVLLDVMMPKIDGYEVCAQLRKDSRTAHLPILMVTALHDRADRLKGIQAGANDFLTKPIDAEEIRLRVKNALHAKRLYDRVQDDFVQLKALENMRDNLTHMIIHDMRSHLMVVSGSYEIILKEKDRLSQTQHQFITMGQNASCDLIEMVSSLLDVSRFEAGQMPLDLVSSDIRDIARVAVASVAVLAQEKALTIQVGGDGASRVVDRDILRRVFVNLLGNAVKFSPEGGIIRVDVSSVGETVRVTVTDHGHGIPPAYHKKIFEKFGQAEDRKNNTKYSTGLGLTFCKLAVEAHGGHIGVKSLVGKGSTFWFELPAPSHQENGSKKEGRTT